MARQRQQTARFDWRGGLNSRFSEDVLADNELRRAENARYPEDGGLEKLTGSKRLHGTALSGGATVVGVKQWSAPSEKEVVAIAGGDLHHMGFGDSSFTSVSPSTPFSTSVPPSFQQFRDDGTGVVLYIASDGQLYRWDGSTLIEVSGAPAAVRVHAYNGRLMATDGSKTLHYSGIGDGTDWSTTVGGSADVETLDLERLVGLGQVGSSLVVAKEDNVARWTGVDKRDIRISTETEGISSEVGCRAPGTLVAVEEFLSMMSQKGLYMVQEAGVRPVSEKIQDAFTEDANKNHWSDAVAAYHQDRQELWIELPTGSETENRTGYVLDVGVGAWAGPVEGKPAASLARYERPDGSATIIRGGYDGFVREEDVGSLEDVASDDSGGSNIAMDVQLPVLHFGAPHAEKALGRRTVQKVQADLGDSGRLVVEWSSEMGSGAREIESEGAGMKDYRFLLPARGKRLEVHLKESTSETVRINGLVLTAHIGRTHV